MSSLVCNIEQANLWFKCVYFNRIEYHWKKKKSFGLSKTGISIRKFRTTSMFVYHMNMVCPRNNLYNAPLMPCAAGQIFTGKTGSYWQFLWPVDRNRKAQGNINLAKSDHPLFRLLRKDSDSLESKVSRLTTASADFNANFSESMS